MSHSVGQWMIDIVLGLVIGTIVGAIIAVNLAIYGGTDDGYEASIGDIFRERPIVGGAIVVVLLGTPAMAIFALRRRRIRPDGRP